MYRACCFILLTPNIRQEYIQAGTGCIQQENGALESARVLRH